MQPKAGDVDPRWFGYGRAYAWLNGTCYLAASVFFLLVEFNITTPAPLGLDAPPTNAGELAERWAAVSAFQRAIWWQLFATNVLYAIGFLALIPVGLALRALLGTGDARADLMVAGFSLGTSVGALQTIINLGAVGHTATAGLRLPADASAAFIALGMVSGTIGSINYWLLNLFFLLVGLAMYHASQLLSESTILPSGLGRLAVAVALLYWVALMTQLLAVLASLPIALVVYSVVILVGGVVLAPLWSFWLGRELHRAAQTASVAAVPGNC
jgi:hypothetical protein